VSGHELGVEAEVHQIAGDCNVIMLGGVDIADQRLERRRPERRPPVPMPVVESKQTLGEEVRKPQPRNCRQVRIRDMRQPEQRRSSAAAGSS
jgi:hypothetical protein